MPSEEVQGLPNPQEMCQSVVGFFSDRLSSLHKIATGGRKAETSSSKSVYDSMDGIDQAKSRTETGRAAESPVRHVTARHAVDSRGNRAERTDMRPLTTEDLGRATWLLLHTLASQYPAKPSKQQRKDVAALVGGICLYHLPKIKRL